jgi:hypothetical protein
VVLAVFAWLAQFLELRRQPLGRTVGVERRAQVEAHLADHAAVLDALLMDAELSLAPGTRAAGTTCGRRGRAGAPPASRAIRPVLVPSTRALASLLFAPAHMLWATANQGIASEDCWKSGRSSCGW